MTISVTRTEHTADDLRRHAARTDDAAIVRRLLALALVLVLDAHSADPDQPFRVLPCF